MEPLLGFIPIAVATDSYKAGHFLMYPEAKRMVAYGEFRQSYNKDPDDTRFVFYGIRYIVKNLLERKWTVEDVENADRFYSTHNAGNTPYPYPKELFLKFIKENDGYFPVKFQALKEGTCAHTHVPVYQITTTNEYARLITFIETITTQVWYPTNVATLSRRTRDLIDDAFDKSADEEVFWLKDYKLHDFGFRGSSCLEAAVTGGCGHLLNFKGTDTMAAAYYAQFKLNGGKPIGESIPATEHSVMTSWRTEKEAIENMIKHFGTGLFACVLDSYDYANCLDNILPTIKGKKEAAGGHMVMRPDSGDPGDAVMMGLRAGEKSFGATVNKKGFKVLNNSSVIQGDGIGYPDIKKILARAMDEGYSAASVTFGMGAGLLQKHNRDTMSFATKLSQVTFPDGTIRDVMKYPKTDGGKISLPGELKVIRNAEGVPVIYPVEFEVEGEDLLEVVYDHGPVEGAFSDSFDDLRARVASEWSALPKTFDPISEPLRAKIKEWCANQKKVIAEYITSTSTGE